MIRNIDNQGNSPAETRQVTLSAIIVIGLSFCLVGRASLLLAVSPGYASVIWPSAGIGLAAMLVFGRSIWPAIFLGSFAVNVWLFFDGIAEGDLLIVATAIFIALGACAQALVAVWLLRRFNVWPDALRNASSVSRLLIYSGPVACIFSASIGVAALLFTGQLDLANAGFSWLNWWVGDAIGVVVFTPLLLVWTGAMGAFWRRRALALSVPSVVALLVVISFFLMASRQDRAHIDNEFQDTAFNISGAVTGKLNTIVSAMGGVQSLFASTSAVDAEDFSTFTQRILQEHAELLSISWARQVPHTSRYDYENGENRTTHLRLKERNAQGQVVAALERDSYSVVQFIEPFEEYRNMLGLDAFVDNALKPAILRARNSGRAAATSQVRLNEISPPIPGILIFAPVYESDDPPASSLARVELISGYVVATVDVQKLLGGAIAGLRHEDVLLQIFDESESEVGQLITAVGDSKESLTLFSTDKQLMFAGRQWRVNISADAAFFAHHRSTGLAMVLTTGLLLCGILGAFNLILAGNERREAIRATKDALTGLANRSEFERRLNDAIISCKSKPETGKVRHVFAYIDLDKFKLVNDSAGHQAGDKLLQIVSNLIRSHIRDRDTPARLGGDEFGLLLENCPIDKASKICQDICAQVRGLQFEWQCKTFQIGASIGVIALTSATNDIADAMTRADIACYTAKHMGRNQVYVDRLDSAQVKRRRTELQRVADLRKSIDNDELQLYKQPIWDMGNLHGEPAIQELLLRLEGPQGEILTPPGMIAIAERYGVMTEVDHWVIHEALQHGKKLCESCAQININLSANSLDDESLVEFVRAEISASDVDPATICFEITETVAISNLNSAMRFINEMKKLGCRFALDDFGAGISSFKYLNTLPVDWLKIDGGLVERVADDPAAQAMVAAIQQIADAMNIPTIAEWVSDQSILDTLQDVGINYVQGFALGKPVPIKNATSREAATEEHAMDARKRA